MIDIGEPPKSAEETKARLMLTTAVRAAEGATLKFVETIVDEGTSAMLKGGYDLIRAFLSGAAPILKEASLDDHSQGDSSNV